MKNKKLTWKQRLFIDEYMKNPNGSEAAKRAGYSPKGCRATASRLLTNHNILTELKRRQSKAADRTDIKLSWILEQIKKLANESESDSDKLKALDMLMKYVGGYSRDHKREFAFDLDNLDDKAVRAIGGFLLEKL